ncbi:MAG: hypothetical protein R6X34_22200 [Chloroflexota bacterium]
MTVSHLQTGLKTAVSHLSQRAQHAAASADALVDLDQLIDAVDALAESLASL